MGINSALASMQYVRIVLFGITALKATGMSRFSIRQFDLFYHHISQNLRNRWQVSSLIYVPVSVQYQVN